MEILFTEVCVPYDVSGVSFQAKVDGNNVTCIILMEALDDIDPQNRFEKPLAKYENNRVKFENIARQKIQQGEWHNGRVVIGRDDVAQ
jgi:hypothetical protein